jgi:hypothetical protein
VGVEDGRKMKERGKPERVSRKRKNDIWRGNKKNGPREIEMKAEVMRENYHVFSVYIHY